MGRIAEPWKWQERGGWYAWVKGSRVRLAPLTESKRVAQKELIRRLELAEAPASSVPFVGRIVALYVDHIVRQEASGLLSAGSGASVIQRTSGFAEACGHLPCPDLRNHHVEAWLESRSTWGPTMRHDAAGAVKAAFNWALDQGYLTSNPIARLKTPRRKAKRDRIPTAPVVAAALGVILIPGLRDILEFIGRTGCRPKEARDLEARHLDIAGGRAILSEHKTAKKTGKDRAIYLTEEASGIVARLAAEFPTGPLFRNSKGGAWTANSLSEAVARLRKRSGVDGSMVAYGLRHLYVTDGIANGVSGPLLAELVGHADLRMLATYSHISDRHDVLREAAAKVKGTSSRDNP